jgi:CubicO group peptidase (beta-lactamase class C family)
MSIVLSKLVRQLSVTLSFWLLASAVTAQTSNADARAANDHRLESADLHNDVDSYMRRAWAHGFSGTVLVAKGQKIILRGAYGEVDRSKALPLTPDTAFDVASLDKQFIAAAVLRLEEMGKLKTSDSIARFFDFVPPPKADITIHQLLSHTSGLPNEYWDEHSEFQERTDFVRFVLRDEPLSSKPGTKWNYSNSAYIVLEEIIARASGTSYEEFLQHALFRPAGMSHTGIQLVRWKSGHVAQYRYWTAGPLTREGVDLSDPIRRPSSSRDLLSSVDDLYLWYLALRDGKILGPDSLKKLFAPVMNDYAYGWNITRTSRGTKLISHGGSDSAQGMLATFRYFADEDVFFVVLSNSVQPGLVGDYFAADLEQIVFGGSPNVPPPYFTDMRAQDAAVAGDYLLSGGGTIHVDAIPGNRLVMSTRDSRASLLIRFPDAAASADSLTRDKQVENVIQGIDKGDFGPLRASLSSELAFERLKPRIQGLWTQLTKANGPLKSISTIYQRAFVFEDDPEIQSFIHVQFEHGDEVIRAIHLDDGTLALNLVEVPASSETVIGPSIRGFTTWDMTLGSSTVVDFDKDTDGKERINIRGTHSVVQGIRQ